jgi:hypothetical protein
VRLAALLLVCTACDVVFHIDHFDHTDASACAIGDEDCDGRDNATDVCPADADPTQADDDNDGVGDACDPDRNMSDNRIQLFDGFDTNANPWSITKGGWLLAGGAFTQPTVGDARVELAVTATTPSVEAIIPQLDTTGNGSVAVFGGMGLSELRCTVVHDQATGAEMLQMTAFAISMQTELTGTGTLRVQGGQHQDGTFYCRARHGANFDAVLTTGSVGAVTIDHIGLVTSGASATVSSITLFNVP